MILGGSTLGLTAFEDERIRKIIEIATPKSFDDLVQVYGLVHGAGAWEDNAEHLLGSGQADISQVLALGDDIMTLLMDKGVERGIAFEIMHAVDIGLGLSDAHKDVMEQVGVPAWYRESCCEIKYLFSTAQAVQYTMHAFRLAWFKTHYPAAFYEAHFSVYADSDTDILAMDAAEVDNRIVALEERLEEFSYDIENYKVEQEARDKAKKTLSLLRMRREMLSLEDVV